MKLEHSEIEEYDGEIEDGVKLTYMEVKDDGIQFDRTITITVGEFIVFQKLVEQLLP